MVKGVLAVVTASILYGLMPIFSKEVLLSGLPTDSFVFWRFTLCALTAGGILLKNRMSIRVEPRQAIEMILAGVCCFGFTAFLLASSYRYMPVGLATMFHFIYPILVMAAMVLFYKTPLTAKKAMAGLLALSGIFLMGIVGNTLSVPGIVLSLSSGATYAAYTIANEKCSFRSLNVLLILFYVSSSASVFFGLKTALFSGGIQLPGSLRNWGFLLIIGVFCTALSLSLFTMGIRTLGASVSSFLNMIEPITSLVAGVLFYHDALTSNQLIGSALVLLAAFVISLENFSPKARKQKIMQ